MSGSAHGTMGFLMAITLMLSLADLACTSNGPDDSKNTDSEIDTETETANNYDCGYCWEADDIETCFGTVQGRVVNQDGSAYPTSVVLCTIGADYPSMGVSAVCLDPIPTDAEGNFSIDVGAYGTECRGYTAESHKYFKINLVMEPVDRAEFSVLYGDKHENQCPECGDTIFHVGDIAVFDRPDNGQAYNSSSTQDYTFDDLTLTLGAGEADLEGALVAVREFDMDAAEEIPAFVPPDLTLDKLYYIEPYYSTELNTDATITLAMGWNENDTGKIYQLGEVSPVLTCDATGADPVTQGELRHCSDVVADINGDITFTTPLITWVGVAKDI